MQDDVFHRRWAVTEDELLQMLWRCHAGESPDVVLLELHARDRDAPAGRMRSNSRAPRTTRHFHHDRNRHRRYADR
ncbi:hypothetical protein GIY23_15505 [Allosaccharopolyspora coralli]|uniref:Uncharacterized protein n=1 Tax=Allosaccharopolyspora coralli TaxID=2665642 RepID=A0A5Q3Q8N1_9PSEU|nr:hypothetical protein [Allosaccharopolyspora coralli]QGK70733.1 hypothetical protein GIY23_15505 [Allosaccharopolyspora coralli]